jgi:hypothetical protein
MLGSMPADGKRMLRLHSLRISITQARQAQNRFAAVLAPGFASRAGPRLRH